MNFRLEDLSSPIFALFVFAIILAPIWVSFLPQGAGMVPVEEVVDEE